MLPKNPLINLLYRYKLVKQAVLNDSIKEAHLKHLTYRDRIQQLLDLYRVDSLVKKASLLNDLYERILLVKAAGPGRQKPLLSFGELAEVYNLGNTSDVTNLRDRLRGGLETSTNPRDPRKVIEEYRSVVSNPTAHSDTVQSAAPKKPTSTQSPVTVISTPSDTVQSAAPKKPTSTQFPLTVIPAPPDTALSGASSTTAAPGPGAAAASEAAEQSTRLSKLKQLLSTVGSKIKSNKQGLIGGGIGLLTGLGAGLLSGRSSASAYERGKAHAVRNMTEEDLKKALLALAGSKK